MNTIPAIASVKPMSRATRTVVSENGQLGDGWAAAPRLADPDEEIAAVTTADDGADDAGDVGEIGAVAVGVGPGGIVTPPFNGAGCTDGLGLDGLGLGGFGPDGRGLVGFGPGGPGGGRGG
jgi:hypothetical protein